MTYTMKRGNGKISYQELMSESNQAMTDATEAERKADVESSALNLKKELEAGTDRVTPASSTLKLGSSPAKQHPPKGKAEHKDLEITDSNKSEKIVDLEDRIEFLNSDISEESSIMKKGKMITQRNKLKNKLKQYKK